MAWQNLHEDLADLFGEFTDHAEEMAAALETRRSDRYWYQKRWAQENRHRIRMQVQARKPANWQPKTTKKHGPALPDWLRRQRARARSNASYAANPERSRALMMARVHKHRAKSKSKESLCATES